MDYPSDTEYTFVPLGGPKVTKAKRGPSELDGLAAELNVLATTLENQITADTADSTRLASDVRAVAETVIAFEGTIATFERMRADFETQERFQDPPDEAVLEAKLLECSQIVMEMKVHQAKLHHLGCKLGKEFTPPESEGSTAVVVAFGVGAVLGLGGVPVLLGALGLVFGLVLCWLVVVLCRFKPGGSF